MAQYLGYTGKNAKESFGWMDSAASAYGKYQEQQDLQSQYIQQAQDAAQKKQQEQGKGFIADTINNLSKIGEGVGDAFATGFAHTVGGAGGLVGGIVDNAMGNHVDIGKAIDQGVRDTNRALGIVDGASAVNRMTVDKNGNTVLMNDEQTKQYTDARGNDWRYNVGNVAGQGLVFAAEANPITKAASLMGKASEVGGVLNALRETGNVGKIAADATKFGTEAIAGSVAGAATDVQGYKDNLAVNATLDAALAVTPAVVGKTVRVIRAAKNSGALKDILNSTQALDLPEDVKKQLQSLADTGMAPKQFQSHVDNIVLNATRSNDQAINDIASQMDDALLKQKNAPMQEKLDNIQNRKAQLNDPTYQKNNGLIGVEFNMDEFHRTHPSEFKATADAQAQIDNLNQQILDPKNPYSNYYKSRDRLRQQRDEQLAQIDQQQQSFDLQQSIDAQGNAPKGDNVQPAYKNEADKVVADRLRLEINKRFDAAEADLNAKNPEAAAEAPQIDMMQKQFAQEKMQAEEKLKSSLDAAQQEAASRPNEAKIKAHEDALNRMEQHIQSSLDTAKEHAATPNETASHVQQEIDSLDNGSHPMIQDGATPEQVDAKKIELYKQKTVMQDSELESIPVDQTQKRPAPGETSGVLRQTTPYIVDSKDVANNRLSFGLDQFELPTEYLRYRGLGKLADFVDNATMAYRRANYDDINVTLNDWKKMAKNDKTEDLFKAANGDKEAYGRLSPGGAEAIDQWKKFAVNAADQLGLPPERRIEDYISHIIIKKNGAEGKLQQFDKNIADISTQIDGATDPTKIKELQAKLASAQDLRQKMLDTSANQFFKDTGAINNRFLKRRSGSENFMQDFYQAAEIYMKAKNRTIHIEPASKAVVEVADKTATGGMESWLKSYANQLRGQKTELDKAFDSAVQNFTGQENLATSVLSKYRTVSSLSKLGFNVGSAVNSTMQLINVAPVIGAKASATGFVKANAMLARLAKGVVTGEDDAMFQKMLRDGVFEGSAQILPEQAVQKYSKIGMDLAFSAIKGTDRYMRMIAYLGAHDDGLAKGLAGQELDRYAYRMSNKVNQNFDSMQVPPAFRSQVAKSLGSMVTFAPGQLIRSGEVTVQGGAGIIKTLGGKATKEDINNIAKLAYMAASAYGMGYVLSNVTGNGQSIPNPFSADFYQSPASQLLFGSSTKPGIIGLLPSSSDKEGDYAKRAQQFFSDVLPTFLVPGYGQAHKTIEGMNTNAQGYATDAKGNVQFKVDNQNQGDNLKRAVFGKYSTQEGQQYIQNLNKPGGGSLPKAESAMVKSAPPQLQQQYYDFFSTSDKITGRANASAEITKAYKMGEPARARRLAADFNAKVADQMSTFFQKYGNIDPELQKQLVDGVFIKITPRGESSRSRVTQDQIDALQNQ